MPKSPFKMIQHNQFHSHNVQKLACQGFARSHKRKSNYVDPRSQDIRVAVVITTTM